MRYLFELAEHGRIQQTDLRQEIISTQQIFSAPDSSFCRKTARQIPIRPSLWFIKSDPFQVSLTRSLRHYEDPNGRRDPNRSIMYYIAPSLS